MWKKPLIGIAIVLAMGVGIVGAQTRGTSTAKVPSILHVDHTTLDMGQVLAGRDVVGTFHFTNTGKRPVKILRAAPS